MAWLVTLSTADGDQHIRVSELVSQSERLRRQHGGCEKAIELAHAAASLANDTVNVWYNLQVLSKLLLFTRCALREAS